MLEPTRMLTLRRMQRPSCPLSALGGPPSCSTSSNTSDGSSWSAHTGQEGIGLAGAVHRAGTAQALCKDAGQHLSGAMKASLAHPADAVQPHRAHLGQLCWPQRLRG